MPVTIDPGQWSGTPGPTLALQWRLDGADLPGATAPRFTPTPGQAGQLLSCRILAGNAAGSAAAESLPLVVHAASFPATGPLDATFIEDTGVQILDGSSGFTGAALTFSVTGPGVSIDPVAGTLRVDPAALHDGVEVVVSAADPDGKTTASYRLTVASQAFTAPALLAPPTLAGPAAIGSAVTLAPGVWNGNPTPTLAFAWCRDGAPIDEVTGPAYTPAPEDDGAALTCRVTATNTVGSVAVETEALAVTYPAPVAVEGVLADVGFDQGSGMQTVAAAPAFAGEALRFAVEGAGATIDPATDAILIPTDTLRAADAVTVTASNSGGTATASFHVTVAPAFVLPLLVAAPALAGTGAIGSEVTLDPGVWVGYPAPSLGFAWCRDGAEISGAIGAAYTPGPEDDGSALTCRVTAINSAGSAAAETAALAIAYAPPVATGELPDEVFDEDSGLQEIPTASAFAGEALRFAVEGRGATIDAATGVVSIDTAEPLSGETVTVTAGNSGGTATASFLVTVEVSDPAAGFMVAADEWTAVPDPSRGTGHRTITVDAAVAVPAGHQLKIWTWSSPGTATAKTATITPGVAYQSNTALKEGETCYNMLWLYRESDGVVSRISEDEKIFLIEAPVVVPPVVPPAEGTIDATVSTAAAARSQIQSWISSGLTGPKTLGITASITGTLDLSGLVSPTHRITVRPLGIFSAANPLDPTCTVKITGGVNLSGSKNIRLYLFRVDGIGQNGINTSNSTDVTVERCFLKGNVDGSDFPTPANVMDTASTLRLLIKDCYTINATSAMIYFHGGAHTDPRIEGCVFDRSGHDNLKAANYLTRLQFINNWFGRAQRGTSAGAHDDCFQFQNGGLDGCLFRGNIHWKTTELWTGGVTGANQGFYIGSTTGRDGHEEYRVRAEHHDAGQGRHQDRRGVEESDTTNLVHRNNLMYSIYGLAAGAYCFIEGPGYKEKNVIVSTVVRDGADNGGLHINTISDSNPNYTQFLTLISSTAARATTRPCSSTS